MTPTTLAETILRDVPRYRPEHPGVMVPDPNGVWVDHRHVLAALTAAASDDLAEAGKVLEWDRDGRKLHMDQTMAFSKSYDWDGWDCFRQEGYGDGASYIIWPDSIGSEKWNLYGTADGLFITDLDGEIAAKAAAQKDYEAHLGGPTSGPWRVGNLESYEGDTGIAFRRVYFSTTADGEIQEAHVRGNNCDANARFIAWARNNVPALLAQIAALRAERDAQRRDLEKTIRNQRAELRRLQALERVHWQSVERWRGTREGLEGKIGALTTKLDAAEAERDALEKHIEDTAKDTHRLLVAAEAKVEELTGALRPFAEALQGNYAQQSDDMQITAGHGQWDMRFSFRLGDFRRARAALTTEADNAHQA